MEWEKIKNKHFFCIDSDNLKNLKTKMYGYAIIDKEIYFDKIPNDDYSKLDGTGSYVYIHHQKKTNELKIFQDINGNYGLYFYQHDDFFAISNSFMILVEYLKDKYELTLNYDYSKAYISAELCSYIYEDTLVNEIQLLPRNIIINIDTLDKKILFDEINYEEHSIDINSEKALRILDQWFNKWAHILQNLKKETNAILLDLTGGLDSRAVLSLVLSSKINLDQISINSSTSKYYAEDYEIASAIANFFKFKLNHKVDVPFGCFNNIDTILNISFYSKLGSSKGLWPETKYPLKKLFNITGYGGECIRGYGGNDVQKNINFRVNLSKKYSKEWSKTNEIYVKKDYKKLKDHFPNDNIELPQRHYKENRSRYHYGKSVVERFLINQINLTPLLDPLLYKLKFMDNNFQSTYLLIALIYERYCPELLDFKIEGGRVIDSDTKNYVKKINKKVPFKNTFKQVNLEKIIDSHIKQREKPYISNNDLKHFLLQVFSKKAFINNFKKYFSEEVYQKILLDFNKDYVGSMCDVFSVIGVFKVIDNVEYSQKDSHNDISKWLKSFLLIDDYENNNVFNFEGYLFNIPSNYIIKSENTISNGKINVHFEKYSDNRNIDSILSGYMDYVKRENGEPLYKLISVDDISIHKIKNIFSNTYRYWFKKNGVIYQIYSFNGFDDLDYVVVAIILSMRKEVVDNYCKSLK